MLARAISKAAALFALLALAVTAARALRESPRVAPEAIVVLYSATDPAAVRTLACPAGRCLFVDFPSASLIQSRRRPRRYVAGT